MINTRIFFFEFFFPDLVGYLYGDLGGDQDMVMPDIGVLTLATTAVLMWV